MAGHAEKGPSPVEMYKKHKDTSVYARSLGMVLRMRGLLDHHDDHSAAAPTAPTPAAAPATPEKPAAKDGKDHGKH